ncbi:UDP-3-O-[3-hydroxymyristoyl] N-acetylglucosamine deacetylase [Desulfobaculum xiamenense]|uniref:UDP-3-O-acyl-N-acetylglucosamine deacetylase n=1 Tax=Desulfobaculum xiamenense TaxID=995050 RepID=A0A846QL54_9BACT|nr:UDP-3-O-[3-hydroxymyristoyl] N-acetylglucosamine deacetylase [Desulfobaculum xiamenense]
MQQTTIQKSVKCSGIGLHSGRKVELVIRPAGEDTGIVFVLKNENGTRFLSPTPESVVGTGLATTLGEGRDSIATVEHLMAALRGMGIDNVQIEVSGGEVPIMDGSAASFVFLLKSAGIRRQSRPRRVFMLAKPFSHRNGDKYINARPYDGFRVDYVIDFDHPMIARQQLRFELTPESFATEVAKARTFGFLRDVEYLQKNGLALGGSLDNAVVLDEYGVVNAEGLRYENEFVRHKILDFIGDMAVSPLPLMGHFEVCCSGHAFNNEFLRILTENGATYLRTVEASAARAAAAAIQEEGEAIGVPAMA